MFFALAAVPLLALTSAAIDYSSLTKESAKVSSALDAAVLAAANNNAIAVSAKGEYAETHFIANYNGDIEFSLTPSVTSSRVRLEATGTLPLAFGKVVGIKDPKLTEASAATLAVENTICVLALSEDDDGSISFDQDMEFLASECAVHSNSDSASAILAQNRLSLPTASSFCAVGGINGNVEPHSKGECSTVNDPYEKIAAPKIGQCKQEFSIQNFATPQNGESENGGALNELAIDRLLPKDNPHEFDHVLTELRKKYDKREFQGSNNSKNNKKDGRDGNKHDRIQDVVKLGGSDMRKLLAAYDSYGEVLDCSNNPLPACFGFENPFVDKQPEEVPSKWLVAEIFDISYGEFLPEPATIPEIVTAGIVELINGDLYSRNNIDGELIPVSSNLTGGNIQLTPGTYCGGLTVDGLRVRFSPGDYVFKDGPLTFLNKSQAEADRVTFAFSGAAATLNIESGSSLKIRSATEGPRQGLAFMQMIDKDAPGNRLPISGTNRIASGGSVTMSGTAYFPEQTLMISGDDTHLGASSPAVGLIADKIQFRGSRGSRVAIAADHKKAGIPPIQPQVDDGVRLVE